MTFDGGSHRSTAVGLAMMPPRSRHPRPVQRSRTDLEKMFLRGPAPLLPSNIQIQLHLSSHWHERRSRGDYAAAGLVGLLQCGLHYTGYSAPVEWCCGAMLCNQAKACRIAD
jgi:hypothetical protein